MKKLLLFGLLLLSLVAVAMAFPNYGSYHLVNSTVNGSVAMFSHDWTGNNLTGFVLSTTNNGSWANETYTGFSGSANWSNYSITLNATQQITEWRFYGNDSQNEWNVTPKYSFNNIIPVAEYQDTKCPLNSIQSTLLYIFIGILLLIGCYAAYTTTIMFFSILAGLMVMLYSFPLWGCNPVYGLAVFLGGFLFIVYDVFLRKIVEQ